MNESINEERAAPYLQLLSRHGKEPVTKYPIGRPPHIAAKLQKYEVATNPMALRHLKICRFR